MQQTDEMYDAVIIGAGLGGLASAAILCKEGWRVCVIDKNEQPGGCLQAFKRKGVKFDSCVHYIGGFNPGETLYSFFNYLGIMQLLEVHKLAEDGFDVVLFEGDKAEYRYGMGYANFIRLLVSQFPGEERAINEYCETVRKICDSFALYNLDQSGQQTEPEALLSVSALHYIESITTNEKLRAVLGGTNLLYSGVGTKTPLYVHALIINSYICGAWRCSNGGDQIAKLLVKEIKRAGSTVLMKHAVKQLIVDDGKITTAVLDTGARVKARNFISGIHPSQVLDLIDSSLLRPAYRHRLKSLENSSSAFVLYAVLKPDTYKSTNRNYYWHKTNDVWNNQEYTADEWPKSFAVFETSAHGKYADAITIMTYMKFDEVKEWADSVNTTAKKSQRPYEYEAFKEARAQKLLNALDDKFPGLKEAVTSYYVSTPLTFRDYMGTNDGSMYGVIKDFNQPLKTFISPKTKIENLFLTGQNIDIHGVLGVTVSAFLTCSMLLGRSYLVQKIISANEKGS